MKYVVRTMILLVVASVLAFGSVGSALAQTPPGELEVKGTISAIDKTIAPPTVTIAPKEGSPVTVKVAVSTNITKAGLGKATIDDLAKDDRAVASYNKDTLVASRISVSQPIAKHHSFVGTIVSENISSDNATPSSFVMTTKTSANVTIAVNGQTKYKIPGVKSATLANFKVGDKLAVLAVEANGGNLALNVNLIPGKPLSVQRVGTVTDYQADKSITLKGKKGESSTFVVTADTKIRLNRGATEVKIGEQAHVLARRDPASDQYTAKEILVFGAKGSQKPEKPEQSGKPETPGKGK